MLQGPQSSSKVRIDSLTGLRGYAALWVLMFHFFEKFNLSFCTSGFLGVDVFFVLSGFVLSLVYLPKMPEYFNWNWYTDFLARRTAKIYPLHILTFVAMASAILVGRHLGYHFATKGVEDTLWTAVCNLFMVHAFGLTSKLSWNSPSWSVSAEWFAYTLLFAPFAFMFRRWRIKWLFLAVLLLWIGFLAFCAQVLHTTIDQVNTNGILRIIPEFASGYFLYRLVDYQDRCGSKVRNYGNVLTIAGLVCMSAVAVWHDLLIALLVPSIVLLLAGLYRGGAISNLLFGNRIAVVMGEASYSIYLTQALVHIVLGLLFVRLHRSSLENTIPGAVVAIACAVLVGIAAFRFVEEPLRIRLLDAFKSRRTAALGTVKV